MTASVPLNPSPSLLGLTLEDLTRRMAPLSPVHARTLWRSLYRQQGADDAFLPPLRRWMEINHPATPPSHEIAHEVASSDGLTRKFLLKLHDGSTVETVLMGYPGRQTACLSSQVGCAMGCVFCATGQMGFTRHLAVHEIVAQVLQARQILGNRAPRNLVLMGMGEPLHNYEAVMTALEIVSDTRGLNIGPSKITISTVGVVPGILRLAAERRPYNLAVSLHGATDADRSRLVPVGRRWPLSELMDACRSYAAVTGRKIFFEWTLIDGENDSPAHAQSLGRLLQGISAHVNLIPLNGTAGFDGRATGAESAGEFQRILREAGLPSTIRQRRGIDVAAGCGQLAASGKQ